MGHSGSKPVFFGKRFSIYTENPEDLSGNVDALNYFESFDAGYVADAVGHDYVRKQQEHKKKAIDDAWEQFNPKFARKNAKCSTRDCASLTVQSYAEKELQMRA
jgi:hypothetical protein